MTGRQRVLRCLEFDRPDRVPRDLWMLPIAYKTNGRDAVEQFRGRWPTDFSGPGVPNSGLSRLCKGDPFAVGTFVDDWGCSFVNIQEGVIGEVKDPPLADWSRLDDLRPPIELLNIDAEAINRACAASDKFVLADPCPRPFERIQFLRGSENVYTDLAEGSSELRELIRRVHEFYCKELELWVGTDVDGVKFMDDWGAQHALLIDPAQWRRVFKPLYADYVRIAHDAGKKIFMHSDGHIFEIYEDLIELGVDAVNSQLFCMNVEAIGARFGPRSRAAPRAGFRGRGRITFWGEMDRQHVLVQGTPDDVRQAVRRVVEALHTEEGGVIAQFELGAGAKVANAEACFAAWAELTGA